MRDKMKNRSNDGIVLILVGVLGMRLGMVEKRMRVVITQIRSRRERVV